MSDKQEMDNVLVAAKHILGTGVVHMNAETQIRKRVLDGGKDPHEALTYVLGKQNITPKRAEAIKKLAGEVGSKGRKALADAETSNPVVEGDSILNGAPKEGLNASQRSDFNAPGGIGGGEAGAPGSARSQVAAVTNSANTGGNTGAGSPAVNNTSNNR